jgi:hypothetical protein
MSYHSTRFLNILINTAHFPKTLTGKYSTQRILCFGQPSCFNRTRSRRMMPASVGGPTIGPRSAPNVLRPAPDQRPSGPVIQRPNFHGKARLRARWGRSRRAHLRLRF